MRLSEFGMRLLLLAVVALTACQKRTPESDATSPADAGVMAAEVVAAPLVPAASPEPDAGVTPVSKAQRYVIKDNKTRCIQAPCMSLDAMPVGSSDPTEKISDVELSALALGADEERALLAEVYGKKGLEVEGEIVEAPSKTGRGGMARVLRVTRTVPNP